MEAVTRNKRRKRRVIMGERKEGFTGYTDAYLKDKTDLEKTFEGRLDSAEYKKEANKLRQKYYRLRRAARKDKTMEDVTPPARIPHTDADLEALDKTEQRIVKAYLEDIRKTSKQIAEEVGNGVSHQMVTNVLDKPEVKELAKKLLWGDISLACEIAIRDGVTRKDPAWIKIAHDYGYVTGKNDSSSCNGNHVTPINDPEAQKALEILGDWLGDNTGEPLTITKQELRGN